MKRRIIPVIIAFVLIVIVAAGMVLGYIIEKYTPTDERMDLYTYYDINDDEEVVVILQDEISEDRAIMQEGNIYISFEMVKSLFNQRFYWDESVSMMVYTTATEVYKIPLSSKVYEINNEEIHEEYEVIKKIDEELYLSIDFVERYSDFDYKYYESPNRINIIYKWGDVEYVDIAKEGEIRNLGGIKSPILLDVVVGDKVIFKYEMEQWTCVQTLDGITGYIETNKLENRKTETLVSDFVEAEYPSIGKDYKINLIWHQVTNLTANEGMQGLMANAEGVNTISPTWFSVIDNEGSISSIASHSYVDAAHRMGLEVWALVDNFSMEISSYEILSKMSSRENLISNLINKTLEYNIDGINIDFETLSYDAGEGYIEFIRELSIQCRANGIILSIDNYVPTVGTAHYSRKEQGIVADYIIVMGYDEHYGGSSKSGSTASYEFVKGGIENTLKEVPASKVINALPFYTRVWKETPESVATGNEGGVLVEDINSEFGRYILSSQAVSMAYAQKLLSENGITPIWIDALKQYYGEYEKDGCRYLIWLEEEESIRAKMELVTEYDIAGVAGWKLSLEKAGIFSIINEYLK
ncbi:MAG: glycosyl hydrolase family 18 [Clostridiales bacterium]|nr:glycosyl hydrolase family 18 [Clostridiales bacterium]